MPLGVLAFITLDALVKLAISAGVASGLLTFFATNADSNARCNAAGFLIYLASATVSCSIFVRVV